MGISVKQRVFNVLFKNQIKQLKALGNYNQVAFINGMLMNSNKAISESEAYVSNADAYSIIRKIAKTAAMIPIMVYKVKDEKALKDYDFCTKSTDYSPQALLKKHILLLNMKRFFPHDMWQGKWVKLFTEAIL